MASPDFEHLRRVATAVRRSVISAIHHAGAGHVGGPLSATDLLTVLYFHELRIDPADPSWSDRDRFIFSKGHSSIALYATLAERGYFPTDELLTFDQSGSRLQGHPDMLVTPGVDMSTGSLGQGLSPGLGMALAARLAGKDYRTYVMIGDGEAQEGQIWEASMVAARYGLDNLCAIVDWNGLQQYGWAESGEQPEDRMNPLVDPAGKWRAFGWHVVELDGHDLPAIVAALDEARSTTGRPTMLIAHTVKGKGVSFMEGDYLWHAKPITDEECELALAELAS
ncbi:MAG: transketolase [Acidimicrobiia bacterium]|nr:transketolase [Acidimicrobiia bacterium]MYC45781.1 transketolase [Acidimicrobiia bacterium]MYI20617.1 transketolase [Acidimicrobiia bacterium]